MHKSGISSKESKTALWTVFLAVLIDLMGFGIVLPLLPFYASTFHASAIQIGLLYSIYSFAQLIFSPVWGSLSDRVGRRPIMLMSTFGASIAYIVFGLAHTLALLFISRAIAGMMGGNISTAQAYVADVTTHEDRAKGMGLIGAAFGIGFVMGPAISTILIHPKFLDFFHIAAVNKFSAPGFFASILSFTSFLLVLFKLPETRKKTENQEIRIIKLSVFSKKFWQSIVAERKNEQDSLFPLLILSVFLLSFSQASLYSSFPIFCSQWLHMSAEQVGMLFVYMGVIAAVVQGGLIKKLSKKFGERNLFFSGNIILILAFIMLPFSKSATDLILILSLMSIGASLNVPTLNSLISKAANPEQVGAVMGTSQGIASLGRVIGPTWGGFLIHFSYRLPFLLTASLLSMTLYVGTQLKKR